MTEKTNALAPPLPAEPGSYILIFYLPLKQSINIGKLGRFYFPPGYYIYVGSAFGSGGLAARIRRHGKLASNSDKHLHWHIDFLREQAQLLEVWYQQQPQRLEHAWANAVGRLADTSILAPGFGSSDCSCPSHLYFVAHPAQDFGISIETRLKLEWLKKSIQELLPDFVLLVAQSPDSNRIEA